MKIKIHGRLALWLQLAVWYWRCFGQARRSFTRVIGYAVKYKTHVQIVAFPVRDKKDYEMIEKIADKYNSHHIKKYSGECPKV